MRRSSWSVLVSVSPRLLRKPLRAFIHEGCDTDQWVCSILKSIWYRMNNFNDSKPTRLSKVYFTWVIRDFGSAEWFHSLLHAIEEQDTQNRIEINIYLTAKLKDDDMNNIIVRGFWIFQFLDSSHSRLRSKMLGLRRTRSPPSGLRPISADPTGTVCSRP